MHLPATIPQVEHEISHEFDVTVLDIDRSTQPPNIFGDVVTENYSSHRRLPSAALAHQQHLALLLTP